MNMRMTFRWYGKNDDKITLQQIQQIPGMDGIVGALFDRSEEHTSELQSQL